MTMYGCDNIITLDFDNDLNIILDIKIVLYVCDIVIIVNRKRK